MTTPQQSSTGTHPPGCYYINTITGSIKDACNPFEAAGLGAIGFVGQNGSWPPENPFPTYEAAQRALQGTGSVPGVVKTVTGWTDAVGNFFGILTQRQTLVRIAEALLGGALIIVAVRVFLQSEAANIISKETKGAFMGSKK